MSTMMKSTTIPEPPASRHDPHRPRNHAAFLLATLACAPTLHAQLILANKGETLPTFEVATVKPNHHDLGIYHSESSQWNDTSYRIENFSLRELIRAAYSAHSNTQLIGGPDALLDTRWDIDAKIGDEDYSNLLKLSREDRDREVHLMQQALLADRFGLKVHVETRDLPVFDLVIDKGGAKLLPAEPAPSPVPANRSVDAGEPAQQRTATHIGSRAMNVTSGITLQTLTTMLARQPEVDGRLVLDKTGLTGKYVFTLHWQPQHLYADAPDAKPASDSDGDGPSLFAALKGQLGLRLKTAKGPVQIIRRLTQSHPRLRTELAHRGVLVRSDFGTTRIEPKQLQIRVGGNFGHFDAKLPDCRFYIPMSVCTSQLHRPLLS